MNAWTIFTWLSIAILVLGSVGVFIWFLDDARRLLEGDEGPTDD